MERYGNNLGGIILCFPFFISDTRRILDLSSANLGLKRKDPFESSSPLLLLIKRHGNIAAGCALCSPASFFWNSLFQYSTTVNNSFPLRLVALLVKCTLWRHREGDKNEIWLTLGKQMQIPTLEFFCEGREQKTSPPLCLYRVHVTLCVWNVQRADVVFADKKTFLRFQISSVEIFPSCFFHHNSVFYIRGKKDKIRIVIFIYLF